MGITAIQKNRIKAFDTFNKLKAKIDDDKIRMPNLKLISDMLTFYAITHEFTDSVNVVEYRTAGRRYVNSRHMGKKGNKIVINGHDRYIELDTSNSYYSHNTQTYCRDIVALIEKQLTTNN